MGIWETIFAWALQALGAVGAIWGLFSSETSTKDEESGKRRLTERGRFAALSVVLGVCGFGLNQINAANRAATDRLRIQHESDRAEEIQRAAEQARLLLVSQKVQLETEAKLQRTRAELIQNQLNTVTGSQQQISLAQNSLFQSQRGQISYLSNLAMVQQNLSSVELGWQGTDEMRDNISRSVDQVARQFKFSGDGDDVYLTTCLSYGDLRLARRPNYTWQIDCIVARPQGRRPVKFEIPLGDARAILVDAFLDSLLSPNLLVLNSRGDTLLTENVSARPESVTRSDGYYTVRMDLPRTRFSSLMDRSLSIRMDVPATRGLPVEIRFRSLDPLARFDTRWRPNWQIKTVEVRTVFDPDQDDVLEVPIQAAVAKINGFSVSFDQLMKPVS
jgi:hypothetical protein